MTLHTCLEAWLFPIIHINVLIRLTERQIPQWHNPYRSVHTHTHTHTHMVPVCMIVALLFLSFFEEAGEGRVTIYPLTPMKKNKKNLFLLFFVAETDYECGGPITYLKQFLRKSIYLLCMHINIHYVLCMHFIFYAKENQTKQKSCIRTIIKHLCVWLDSLIIFI